MIKHNRLNCLNCRTFGKLMSPQNQVVTCEVCNGVGYHEREVLLSYPNASPTLTVQEDSVKAVASESHIAAKCNNEFSSKTEQPLTPVKKKRSEILAALKAKK